MRRLIAIPAFALLSFAGCQSGIGDSCVSDTECARGQVCDTTSPGGYCIEYGCSPNECPPEAVCVDFVEDGNLLVSACMARCDNNSDCRTRDDYVCREDIGPVPFCGIEPIDTSATDSGADDETPADGSADGSGAGTLEGSG